MLTDASIAWALGHSTSKVQRNLVMGVETCSLVDFEVSEVQQHMSWRLDECFQVNFASLVSQCMDV